MKRASASVGCARIDGFLGHARLIYGTVFMLVLVGIGMAVVTWSSLKGSSAEELLEEATALYEKGNHLEAMVFITRGLKRGENAQTNKELESLRRKIVLQKMLVVIQKMITEGEHEAAKVQLVSLLKESPDDEKGQFLMKIVENALARKHKEKEATGSETQRY